MTLDSLHARGRSCSLARTSAAFFACRTPPARRQKPGHSQSDDVFTTDARSTSRHTSLWATTARAAADRRDTAAQVLSQRPPACAGPRTARCYRRLPRAGRGAPPEARGRARPAEDRRRGGAASERPPAGPACRGRERGRSGPASRTKTRRGRPCSWNRSLPPGPSVCVWRRASGGKADARGARVREDAHTA
jgi:hypothetical protein